MKISVLKICQLYIEHKFIVHILLIYFRNTDV